MCPEASHIAIQLASIISFRSPVYEDCRVVDVSVGFDCSRASVGADQLAVHLAAGGSSLRSTADDELTTKMCLHANRQVCAATLRDVMA